METVSGINNWKLVVRRKPEGISILQAQTCDTKAALPEELFGLPVVELEHHALAPGRPMPDGEQIQMTCGVGKGEWDNRGLQELTLPETLARAGDYALFNCTDLSVLRLSERLRYWGGGALMNCRKLDTIHLKCSGKEGEVLAGFADELIRELDVTLYWEDGRVARLIFPEYAEVYEENVPHHQFDFRIQGAGYSYHHCFYQRKLNLRDYDELWKGFLSMGHEKESAMKLAWWRLRYPLELSERAENQYWDYLRTCRLETARWRMAERDAAGLRFLLSGTAWERQELSQLCDLARETADAETLAALLEEQHRRFPSGMNKSFDL